MAIVRWNPWNDLFNLHSQMDELFNSTMGRDGGTQNGSDAGYLAVDISQTDDAFTIEASVPGFKPDDVEITLEDRVLTIRGTRRDEKEETGKKYVRRERRAVSVSRQIGLPEEVRADEIAADFEDGVLTITVPRAEKAQPRRIPVNSHGALHQGRVIDAPSKDKN